VYTRDGMSTAQVYHTTCSKCKDAYFPTYEETNTSRTFYTTSKDNKIMMTSRPTAFTLDYIKEVLVDIQLGRSFLELCERYSKLYGSDEYRVEVFKTRLEDVYFIAQLLKYFNNNVSFSKDNIANQLAIVDVCDEAAEIIFAQKSKWAAHNCKIKGCSEGFVMCDGNEIINRRICAAPKQHFKLGKGMPNAMGCCPNTPILGGKNKSS